MTNTGFTLPILLRSTKIPSINKAVFMSEVVDAPTNPIKGRGTASALPGRFAIARVELDETGEPLPNPATQEHRETAKSLITRNQSPDVGFNLSINPYRGCEHGCIYCFARPTHAYLDLSPGIDFETRISIKHNAPALFERELRRPGYRCEPIALGINTDAYQPVERHWRITRRLLEVAFKFRQPVSIITKSALVLRDRDILAQMAEQKLVHAAVSVTTLDNGLKRILEPRTASGDMRLKVVEKLRTAGIPVSVLIAPVIPFINDRELESIVAASAEAGAQSAGYVLLRLPHEVAPLFVEWLHTHFPERAERVLACIREMRGGKLYDSRFGVRMTGQGTYANLINQRFNIAKRKFGLSNERLQTLDCSRFKVPDMDEGQLTLF